MAELFSLLAAGGVLVLLFDYFLKTRKRIKEIHKKVTGWGQK